MMPAAMITWIMMPNAVSIRPKRKHYIDSINSFTISSTKDVTLTLVQYPSKSGGGTASCNYRLISGGTQSTVVPITGNYTSTNTSIKWVGVPAGTYWVEITNIGIPDVDGNGYITTS
jgi:hypothetical protein